MMPRQITEQIQSVFYNSLANLTLDFEDINRNNIDVYILNNIQQTINSLIETSLQNHDSINLPTGTTLTYANCPGDYRAFFTTLLQLVELKQRNNSQLLQQRVFQLASVVSLQFSERIESTKQFILEAKGINQLAPVVRQADNSPITPQLIRDTFYNEMVNQCFLAIEEEWITKEELFDQDAFIFFALPALTLIEAIYQSKDVDGIRLLNDRVLTRQNCPHQEGFSELFIPLIEKKAAMTAMSDDALKVIKILCLNKDMEFPADLEEFKTPTAIQCAAALNQVASLISRRGMFKQTVTEVMNLCMESLQAEVVRPH